MTVGALRGGAALRPATSPPEMRGLARDEVRLQTVDACSATTTRLHDLPSLLQSGDLLVANRSSLRPAAVDARFVDAQPSAGWPSAVPSTLLVHLVQRFGPYLWLLEPRIDEATPGPLPLAIGSALVIAGVPATLLGSYPGLPRLRFLRSDGDLAIAATRTGRPIRYGYLGAVPDASAYETVFGDRPGSAEMASAGRPFSRRVLDGLSERGVQIARITLHAGVSGLEAPDDDDELHVPAEPFEVDRAAARAVNDTLEAGGRVVAIGTGAVRALESAWDGSRMVPRRGWTRKVLAPGRSGRFLSGLITGLHDPEASHLRLLRAVIGERRVADAYIAAKAEGLLAHEFGDLQLLWREDAPVSS